MVVEFKSPLVVVEDVQKSKAFYETFLDQKLRFDFSACQIFESGLVLQSKKSMTELFQFPQEKLLTKGIDVVLYFEVEDFDAFVSRLQKWTEIEYVHGVLEYEWGQRSISFYDLDEHAIDVGESMTSVFKRFLNQGMSLEEIAKRAEHPLDYVKSCLL